MDDDEIGDDGVGYEAIIPKFPDCHVFADTIGELDEMVMLTIGIDIEGRKKRRDKIPKKDNITCPEVFLRNWLTGGDEEDAYETIGPFGDVASLMNALRK